MVNFCHSECDCLIAQNIINTCDQSLSMMEPAIQHAFPMAEITYVNETKNDSRTSLKSSTQQEKTFLSFPAGDNDYRYLRKRAATLCATFNALPIDALDVDRARAWHKCVTSCSWK